MLNLVPMGIDEIVSLGETEFILISKKNKAFEHFHIVNGDFHYWDPSDEVWADEPCNHYIDNNRVSFDTYIIIQE